MVLFALGSVLTTQPTSNAASNQIAAQEATAVLHPAAMALQNQVYVLVLPASNAASPRAEDNPVVGVLEEARATKA